MGIIILMIKNPSEYNAFENNFIVSQGVNISQNIRLANDMYNLAVDLGAFNSEFFNESTTLKIKIAKILNSVSDINK